MVQVHDYAGVSMFSRDASSKQAAKEASKLFSDHYPELLSGKYFVNVRLSSSLYRCLGAEGTLRSPAGRRSSSASSPTFSARGLSPR